MEFRKNLPIYLQIADYISEHILTQAWEAGSKIASVRELAAEIEVNPNTVMRTYSHLQELGVIYNKRGIGFFVANDAAEQIRTAQKTEFLQKELPALFKKMKLLGIQFEEISALYKKNQVN